MKQIHIEVRDHPNDGPFRVILDFLDTLRDDDADGTLQAAPIVAPANAVSDALMKRISKVAAEIDCPDGTASMDWVQEMAEIGHKASTMAPVAIERTRGDDLTRVKATPIRPGAVIAGLTLKQTEAEDGDDRSFVERLIETTANARLRISDAVDKIAAANPGRVAQAKAKPSLVGWFVGQVMCELGGKASPAVVLEIAETRILGIEDGRTTVDGVPVMSAEELPEVPERAARYLAQVERRQQPVEALPASVAALDLRPLLEIAWELGASTANYRRDRPAEYVAEVRSGADHRAVDIDRVIADGDRLLRTLRAGRAN